MGSETEEDEAELGAILAAAKRRPDGGARKPHSPLYEWMWARAERLATELNPPRTPNWEAIAEEFRRAKVLDGQGKAPTAERVRKTWWQVRADRRRQQGGEAVRPAAKQPAVPPPPPLAQEMPSAQQGEGSSEDEQPAPRFGFARPRT